MLAICIFASRVERTARNCKQDQLAFFFIRKWKMFTQYGSSRLPLPDFHFLALAVTAAYPSSLSFPFDSFAHNHIAAFFRSRTDPREILDTTSCEYTKDMMRFFERLDRAASVRQLYGRLNQAINKFQDTSVDVRWCETINRHSPPHG